MPTVPIDSRQPSADMPAPSETDLMMALATMKELGRIPTFDERFRGTEPDFIRRLDPSKQGEIEDRTKMSPLERTLAEGDSLLAGLNYKPPTSRLKTSQGPLARQLGYEDIGKQRKIGFSRTLTTIERPYGDR